MPDKAHGAAVFQKEKFMSFKQKYPDFAAIENLVVAARVERAIYVSQAIVAGIAWVVGAAKRLAVAVGSNLEAERDRRAIEADSFLKRSVPRY
jgi:predicted GNAT superfamily acetyltransferase